MTDQPTPPPPYAPPPEAAPPGVSPAAPDKPKPWAIILILIVIGGFLGFVLWSVRNNADAGSLAVGTCFDQPAATEDISTVEKHDCTEPHDAEVFHVAEYTGDSYPISITIESFVDDVCLPVFATYVGTAFEDSAELNVGWFYPNRNGWDGGDRTVTCYALRVDAAKMTESVKGSGGS